MKGDLKSLMTQVRECNESSLWNDQMPINCLYQKRQLPDSALEPLQDKITMVVSTLPHYIVLGTCIAMLTFSLGMLLLAGGFCWSFRSGAYLRFTWELEKSIF